LSIALATDALTSFDPVVFVDLAAATEGSDIAPAVAAALGIASAADPIAALVDRLGEADAFVVLDNLEQVRGAAHAVASLTSRLPSLKVVATSRSPLRLAAEREHRVQPLAMEDARQLFVTRAQTQVDHVGQGEVGSLDRICAKLDCLPLALELAAARVRLLALDALEQRLERYGFAALGRGSADTPERHQSLGATIAWSVDLLDPDVRHVYECLGCFQGGATLDAIETVVQPGDPIALLDALDLLVDASLLPAPDLHGPVPRFRLLETIRQDAAGRAEARPDALALHRRHAEHFAGVFARGARVGIEELANLRVAFTLLLDTGDPEAAARLAISGRRVWFDAGALTEMRELYSRILDLPIDPLTRARAAILAGSLGYVIGRLRDTEQLEDAIATLREAGDFDPIAINAFCYLGSMALDRGAITEANTWAAQAIEWAQRSHDVEGESIALDFSAYVARNARDFQRAADLMAQAVEIARGRAAPADLSQRLSSLSFAMGAVGAHEAARTAALEALELARGAGARPSERDALVALGEAVLPTNARAAIGHLARAVATSVELGQEALEELTRFARALKVGGDTEHAALITGVALARQRASAVDDPEGAEIRAELEGQLDPAGVARGTALEPQGLVRVVTEVLSGLATQET
jgi:predicted ATPase